MAAIIQIMAITVSAILSLEGPIFSEEKSEEEYNGTISEEKLETAVTSHADIRTLIKTKSKYLDSMDRMASLSVKLLLTVM